MEATALDLAAAVAGLFLGTFLFSRVGSWIEAIVIAARTSRDRQTLAQRSAVASIALAAILNSGPWLLAGMLYWAYHVLSKPHLTAWNWFFAAIIAAVPIWLAVLIYLHHRGKRTQAAREENAV